MKRYIFIMLAAGYSKRFGSNKLLYEIGGVPLYERMLRTLIDIRNGRPDSIRLIVVTQYPEISERVTELGIPVVINPDPSRGISSSFQEGIRYAMADKKEDECWVCFVADQPYLETETINRLLDAYEAQEKGIGCLAFGERLGNPVIFSEKYVDELLGMSGDVGGKQVCRKHPEDLMLFQIKDERELSDLDVPGEL